MNREELIIKYLDNQLSPDEKINFERQLSESEILQKEFNKYANFKTQIDELKIIDSNKLYFNSLLSRFQDKMQARNKGMHLRNFGYAFAILAMLIISFAIFNIFYSENNQSDLIRFTESLTPSEKVELLRTLNDDPFFCFTVFICDRHYDLSSEKTRS